MPVATFQEMKPYVEGDKILKEPISSKWCCSTCLDVAVAYAISKVNKLHSSGKTLATRQFALKLNKWMEGGIV